MGVIPQESPQKGLFNLEPGLNEKQLVAINQPCTTNLRIIAGPGTGKTKTLVNRVLALLNQGLEPSQLLLVCYTSKALNQQRQRLKSLVGPEVEAQIPIFTFHSYCQQLLAQNGTLVGIKPDFRVMDEFDQAIIFAHVATDVFKKVVPYKEHKDYLTKISKIKHREIVEGPLSSVDELTRRILNLYNQAVRNVNFVDYDDLIIKGIELLRANPQLVDDKKVILVDEFQDLSSSQWELTKLIVGPRASLSVVGDPFQSIYSFQGANPHLFKVMDKELENVCTVTLNKSYRSSKQIIGLTQTLLEENYKGNLPLPELTSEISGSSPVLGTASIVDREARWIAQTIRDMLKTDKSLKPSDIAVLTRMNFSIPLLAQTIESVGFTASPTGYITILRHFKPLYILLKCANDPNNEYLRYLLRNPKKLLSTKKIDNLIDEGNKYNKSLWSILRHDCNNMKLGYEYQTVSHKQLVDAIIRLQKFTDVDSLVDFLSLEAPKLYGTKHSNRSRQLLTKMFDMLRSLSPYVIPGENILGQILSILRSKDELEIPNTITISTIHSAKGMEWPVVFIPGCEEGIHPSFLADSPEDIQEELRVLYVGMTRARMKLFLSYHNSSISYVTNEFIKRKKSRFLTQKTLNHLSKSTFNTTATAWKNDDIPNISKDPEYHSQFEEAYNIRARYPKVFTKPSNSTWYWSGNRPYPKYVKVSQYSQKYFHSSKSHACHSGPISTNHLCFMLSKLRRLRTY